MIYFDNSATTKPYPEVIDSFITVSTEYFGNPSSIHGIGARAENLLLQARKQIAELLEVKSSEIYFTSGGTEGNNLAIKGAAHANSGKGKHIITTAIEHASVMDACMYLQDTGYEITYLPVNETGKINLDDLKKAIRKDTILVSAMHVNNETGAIQPIEKMGEILSGFHNILFHVDHVQGVGKVPLDLKRTGVDLCTISGHKFHGLKGTGAIYIREGVKVSPLFSGGSQESKIRSGTENVAGAVALAKALRIAMEKLQTDIDKLRTIREIIWNGLQHIEGVEVNSPNDGAPHIVNFSIPGVKSEVFVHSLEEEDLFVSTTSACSSKKKSPSKTVMAMFADLVRAESVIRISLSYQNEPEEAEMAIELIRETINKLQKVMR
ncbi:cysteine desulfurase [Peribacillus cavernae]|uniref:Cysteine desulfurase n=1 Tax=Peribacillus cavernae TaxID=1674310 RepID=A0A433HGX5_9BACI|nr:cysteine desulfurase family protein [Peribacillus cavernae]MDQ0221085.1 cysteine desulfurase [Peribacillus cavernae]RUQ27621.1 cysteine desulfurase [Peribacillus cavernae]